MYIYAIYDSWCRCVLLSSLVCLIIMTLQFPDCDDEDAISVSCLDIYYTVKFKKTKVLDDKDNKITPLLLDNPEDNISGWLSLFSELCPTTRFLSPPLSLSLSPFVSVFCCLLWHNVTCTVTGEIIKH